MQTLVTKGAERRKKPVLLLPLQVNGERLLLFPKMFEMKWGVLGYTDKQAT